MAAPMTSPSSSSSSIGLFPSTLVSPSIAAELPAGYSIRALQPDDFAKGFLECLSVLTAVGEISEARFRERYDWMEKSAGGSYYVVVIEANSGGDDRRGGGRIVGTGALVLERKL